jgi:hypothetical protein
MMFIIATVALAALVASPVFASVDFNKPSVVVSFSGYKQAIADIDSLGEATGQPGMGQGLDMMVKMILQGKLDALNLNRPCGAAAYYAENVPEGRPSPFLIFLPVSDMQKFVKTLEGMKYKSKKIDEDHYQFWQAPSGEEDPVCVKKQGNWLFISSKDLPLTNLPADPVSLLGGLEKKYLVAVQLNGKNQGVKWLEDIVLDTLHSFQTSMARAFAGMAGPGEFTPPPRPKLADLGPGGQMLEESGKEVDTITIGLKFDKSNNKMTDLQLDLQITALPGTALAKRFNAAPEQPSRFAGFYDPSAAVTMNVSSQLDQASIAQMKQQLAMFKQQALAGLATHDLNEDEMAAAKNWIERLSKSINSTITEGNIDAGLKFKYAENASTFIFGAKLVDAKECDYVLRQLSQLLSKQQDVPVKLTLDAENLDDEIKLHKLGPAPPSPLLGPNPDCYIGVSSDAIFVALGTQSVETLKAALKRSKKMAGDKVPTVRLSVDVAQVVQMANELSPENMDQQVVAQLGSGNGKNVKLTVTPIANGMTQTLEVSPKVVRALMDMGMAQGMGGGAPGLPAEGPMPPMDGPPPAGGIGMPRNR